MYNSVYATSLSGVKNTYIHILLLKVLKDKQNATNTKSGIETFYNSFVIYKALVYIFIKKCI